MLQKIQEHFYLIILFCIFLAYLQLDWVISLTGYVKLMLAFVIFLMGITLEFNDFKECLKKPIVPAIGISLQYLLMPLLAFLLAKLFSLDSNFAIGIILVACSPGGTVSNVFTYISKADLPLSVVMTFSSTLLAPFMLPMNMYLYARQWIDVDMFSLFKSSIEIVLIPLILGMIIKIINNKLNINLKNYEDAISVLAVLIVSLIILVILTAGFPKLIVVDNLVINISKIIIAVSLLHGLGLFIAYQLSLRFGEKSARTVGLEVGMQNSGLASVLAQLHFSPISVIPTVVSGALQCRCGSVLINWWRK